MLYSLNPITMSITIAITSITCITASILQQFPSLSQSRLSRALQHRSYNNVHHVHHHRHHVYHMNYSFNPITMSPTSPSRLSHALQLQTYINFHHHRHRVYHIHYTLNTTTISITIAITFITCIITSILKQCQFPLSASPSSPSRAL